MAMTLLILVGAYASAMPARVPYETASPHQPYRGLTRFLLAVRETIIAPVQCQGDPECDGTEEKLGEECGPCVSRICKETGAEEKLCAIHIIEPWRCNGTIGCTGANNIDCAPPIF